MRRLALLDVIRGIALWGIIQINLPGYLIGAKPAYELLRVHHGTFDWLAWAVAEFFVAGKFYPIFAFLFGYGFYLQRTNLARLGLSAKEILMRRYLFLLLAGLLHGVLLFDGDILTMYALAGMILTQGGAVDRASLRYRIRRWAALSLLVLIFNVVLASMAPDSAPQMDEARQISVRVARMVQSSYWDTVRDRSLLYLSLQVVEIIEFLPQLVLIMLAGVYCARIGMLRRPVQFLPMWRLLSRWSLIVGVPINLAKVCIGFFLLHEITPPGWSIALDEVLNEFALTLSPAIIGGIVMVISQAHRPSWIATIGRIFSRMGRLALTNYIGQSCAMLFLLTSSGFALGSRLNYWQMCLFGVAICSVQAGISTIWSKSVGQGPLEWLWRYFTYWPLGRARESMAGAWKN